jgi:hypothetical protein
MLQLSAAVEQLPNTTKTLRCFQTEIATYPPASAAAAVVRRRRCWAQLFNNQKRTLNGQSFFICKIWQNNALGPQSISWFKIFVTMYIFCNDSLDILSYENKNAFIYKEASYLVITVAENWRPHTLSNEGARVWKDLRAIDHSFVRTPENHGESKVSKARQRQAFDLWKQTRFLSISSFLNWPKQLTACKCVVPLPNCAGLTQFAYFRDPF